MINGLTADFFNLNDRLTLTWFGVGNAFTMKNGNMEGKKLWEKITCSFFNNAENATYILRRMALYRDFSKTQLSK